MEDDEFDFDFDEVDMITNPIEYADFYVAILVDAEPGEERCSISWVSGYDMKSLDPLFQAIKANRGYFPEPDNRVTPGNPRARDLYRDFVAWDMLNSMLPNPIHGFNYILSVRVFAGKPDELSMLSNS